MGKKRKKIEIVAHGYDVTHGGEKVGYVDRELDDGSSWCAGEFYNSYLITEAPTAIEGARRLVKLLQGRGVL